jgi:hypothetical protein
MMADNFRGMYANSTDNQNNVKVFSSKNANLVNVMIMNQDQNANFSYTVRLDNNTVSGNKALKVNVDAGVSVEYNETINSQATVVLTFNKSGVLVKKTEYSLQQHAASNQPPTVTQYVSTGIGDDAVSTNGTPAFDMNVYPNPTAGKLTVAVSGDDQRGVEVEMVNLVGQLVYHKNLEFKDGKEMIDLQEGVANGVYIVKVKNADDKVLTKKIILERK